MCFIKAVGKSIRILSAAFFIWWYMTCNNCLWFVDDCEKLPEDYKHEIAKNTGKGFCLVKDFFTVVEPSDEACEDFNFDGE